MERLNPKGPEESMSEEEEERFLEGKDEGPSASPSPHRMHH